MEATGTNLREQPSILEPGDWYHLDMGVDINTDSNTKTNMQTFMLYDAVEIPSSRESSVAA
jgi:hypothetical protein